MTGPGQDRIGAGKRARAGLRVAWDGAGKRGRNRGRGQGLTTQLHMVMDRGWD
jgi:hypothetical protein